MGEGVDYWRMRISIHAPREGCDKDAVGNVIDGAKFQSTHPVRGATSLPVRSRTACLFQSTHPVRGATCSA